MSLAARRPRGYRQGRIRPSRGIATAPVLVAVAALLVGAVQHSAQLCGMAAHLERSTQAPPCPGHGNAGGPAGETPADPGTPVCCAASAVLVSLPSLKGSQSLPAEALASVPLPAAALVLDPAGAAARPSPSERDGPRRGPFARLPLHLALQTILA